jgi:hypothetical protein
MLRLAADENFNGDIVRGLLRRKPDLDIVAFRALVCQVPTILPSSSGRPARGESS